MSQHRILVCTVGGSDEPIVTAARAAPWDEIVFVCSKSSRRMLTDIIQVAARDGQPATTRPPIPEQAALSPGSWSCLEVPEDDPDAIYTILISELDRRRAGTPSPEITIDFTGGTKSMSAGAVLAVAARPGLHLQVTSGKRSDLVRVVDGTQRAVTLGTDRIAMDRQIARLRETWLRFGYEEAAAEFTDLVRAAEKQPGSVDPALFSRLKFWAGLSRGFAAWDRFDRTQAIGDLQGPLRKADPELQKFASLAEALRPSAASSLGLFDLLRNAQRCAERGRYDDAVARCYRLWEWTVQWLLKTECNLDTGAVDPSQLDADSRVGLEPNGKGKYQLGSKRAWDEYRKRFPNGEVTAFWNAEHTRAYENFGPIRNASILAHGTAPIGADNAGKILAWTAGPFIEMLRQAARRLNQPDDMPQLPRVLPEPRLVTNGSAGP